EPSKTLRQRLASAMIVLVLLSGIGEAAYGWFGAYRETPETGGLMFWLESERFTFSSNGILEIEGGKLFILGGPAKQIEVPLASQSIVGGRIQTRDFGTLKL